MIQTRNLSRIHETVCQTNATAKEAAVLENPLQDGGIDVHEEPIVINTFQKTIPSSSAKP